MSEVLILLCTAAFTAWEGAAAGDAEKLNVLCGSSMSEPVKKVADAFQRDTGVQVELTLGGCEVLFPQLELGAPADVFVGHAPFADKLKEKGLREDRLVVLGALRPTLVVAKGNPKGIHSLADLAREDIRVGLPDARYSTCGEMFEKGAGEAHLLEGIKQRVVYTSRAHQELATALRTDNVDAVIVWNFIAAMHRDVFDQLPMEIAFPSAEVFATTVSKARNAEAAHRFLDYLERSDSKAVFAGMGYGQPETAGALKPAKLTLYCAAGVHKPIDELIAMFKVRHPGVEFETVYQGSGALLTQIELTKTGDLYVAGDDFFMKTAQERGLVANAAQFAVFTPVLATPKGNPAKLASFQDLTKPGIRLGLGDDKIAAVGHAARAYLDRLGLWTEIGKNVVVTTPTVDQLAIQCASGNLDAAIIWDATAWQFKDRLDVVAKGDEKSRVGVPIGVLNSSVQREAADAFLHLVVSPEATPILQRHGFVPAPKDGKK